MREWPRMYFVYIYIQNSSVQYIFAYKQTVVSYASFSLASTVITYLSYFCVLLGLSCIINSIELNTVINNKNINPKFKNIM